MNLDVQALTEYQGQLAVGGRFNMAGPMLCPRVTMWNGTEWPQLGSGLNGRVRLQR